MPSYGMILAVCLAASPACQSADSRTCLRTRVCHEQFVALVNEKGEPLDHEPKQHECFFQGQMFIAKPGGWQDQNPSLLLKAFRCGEDVGFKKAQEHDA